MRLAALLSLIVVASPMAQTPALTEQERALTTFIDANNAQAIALLEKAVNINSGTMNFDGVRAVGALFRAEFDALGFTTSWVDGTAV
ncbi:MAG: M20 family peptidase, partial [Vicinamibacterales bacterium]